MQRPVHSGLNPHELADRLAIRELIDSYAHCADRRDVEGQMSLFTADTEFMVYTNSRDAAPTQVIHGREELRPVFENLRSYEATTHFNGQSTVSWAQDSATGVTYCLAHHVKAAGARKSLMIASIRYLDSFVRLDRLWYFRQRKLMVDWIDNRTLGAA
jgi:SnoaL-like domain